MATKITEGYDIPTDLKHTSKYWFGMTFKHALMVALAIVIAFCWWQLAVRTGIPYSVYRFGFWVIGLTAVCAVWLNLDIWMWRFVMWCFAPHHVTQFDKTAKQISGIMGITGNVYWNVVGDPCAILRLTALNSDRIDPAKHEAIEAIDKIFFNSLPCPIQIVGYTQSYDISKYIANMLACANNLPKKVMKYKIAHLNFYQQYIKANNIRDRSIFMIIKSDASTDDPLETLETNVAIIRKNLAASGVVGRRLIGDEIATTMIGIATGVGAEGVDYLTPYTDVEA